jgi:hypothetical protein
VNPPLLNRQTFSKAVILQLVKIFPVCHGPKRLLPISQERIPGVFLDLYKSSPHLPSLFSVHFGITHLPLKDEAQTALFKDPVRTAQ